MNQQVDRGFSAVQGRRTLRYAIIGAGMAGIMAGVKLVQRGEHDFVIFEKGDRIGGTWRDNRYPGLACDTPAHSYTYSFAPYPEWKANFAGGPEILTYFEKVVTDFGLQDYIRLNAEVTACRFDEERARWIVEAAGQSPYAADVVIVASGILHHPRLPDISGMDSFSGRSFHSARWDDRASVDHARVGVIGGGSTGVQLVSNLAGRAARLVHFQRTPQWILPAPYLEYSDQDREAFRNDVVKIDAIRNDPNFWAGIQFFTRAITNPDGPEIAQIEATCLANLEQSVADPALREKLRPSYRAACKRIVISWSYYDAVQSPSVFVETGQIDRIVSEGVRMHDGTVHELDTIVYATGFHADRFIRPATVVGRGGRTLDECWSLRPTAHYAISVPGFPNMFMLNGPGAPVGNFSLIDISERQWGYIDQLLELLRGGMRTIEPSLAAHDHYEQRRIKAARTTIFGSGCSSWYLDKEGVPSTWPWTYDDFAAAMASPDQSEYALEDCSGR